MHPILSKTAALLLVSVLLCGITAGCGKPEPVPAADNAVGVSSSPSPLTQAKQYILDHWFSMLSAYEHTHQSLNLSLDAMQEYYDARSWESLLKARAMTAASMALQKQLEVPPLNLTQAQAQALREAGMEINAIERSYEGNAAAFANFANTAQHFFQTVHADALLLPMTEEYLPGTIENSRELFRLEGRMLCYDTNFLLLELDALDQWDIWMEALPFLSSCADPLYPESAPLEQTYMQALDAYEVESARRKALSGISEYTLELVQDAMQTGSYSALSAQLLSPSHVPAWFPEPSWLLESEWTYLTTDAAGEKHPVDPLKPLSVLPSACYITCARISPEDLNAYRETLYALGIHAVVPERNPDSLLVSVNDCSMLIEPAQNQTVVYLSDPIGCLAPGLYLQLLNAS